MKLVRGVIVCIFILFFIVPAQAYIGLSPPSYTVDFEPGLKKDFSFQFLTDAGKKLNVVVEGDLAKYVTASEETIIGTTGVTFSLHLPRSIDVPGPHLIFISAVQPVDPKRQGLALYGVIKGRIVVNVPYPGKYVEASLTTENAKAGSSVPYLLKLQNLGSDIVAAKPQIDIFDASNKSVDTLYLEAAPLEPSKKREYEGKFNSDSYLPGRYRSTAVIEYGGRNPAVVSSLFRIGELAMHIVNHSDYFARDTINRFDITVESQWNDLLENVYAEVSIPDYSIRFTTPSVSLDGFGNAVLTGYFDTRAIQEDSFRAIITVNYAGKKTEKSVILHFKGVINYVLIALILGIVLLALLLLWLVRWMRRLPRRNMRKKNDPK